MTDEKTEHPRMLAAVVDRDLGDAFKAIAKANERSVSAELRVLIREHVERLSDNGTKETVQ